MEIAERKRHNVIWPDKQAMPRSMPERAQTEAAFRVEVNLRPELFSADVPTRMADRPRVHWYISGRTNTMGAS